jgi:predicted phosphodiesterase
MSFRRAEAPRFARLALAAAAAALSCTPAAQPSLLPAPPGAAVAQAPPAARPATTPATLPNDPDSVKFLVIGDSGTGDRAQYEVATQIAAARARFPFEFAIMLGDNLYGSEQPRDYERKFAIPYRPLLEAGVKFYATLGNHDEPSQRFYEPFNMNGRRFYTHDHDEVRFFALDSTYMAPEQVAWLRRELEQSDEKWKVAYMHHPLYSSGEKHGSERDLQVLLEPLFLAHGVDVVFAGHEHFYERLHPQKGITYFTPNSALTAAGFDTDRSFTLVEVFGDHLFFETISRTGRSVDSGTVTRREVSASPPQQSR